MQTLQVRNVPDALSRELKARAAAEGRSLSDYVLRELERVVARPTRAEVLRHINARPAPDLPPAADVLRAERAAR